MHTEKTRRRTVMRFQVRDTTHDIILISLRKHLDLCCRGLAGRLRYLRGVLGRARVAKTSACNCLQMFLGLHAGCHIKPINSIYVTKWFSCSYALSIRVVRIRAGHYKYLLRRRHRAHTAGDIIITTIIVVKIRVSREAKITFAWCAWAGRGGGKGCSLSHRPLPPR